MPQIPADCLWCSCQMNFKLRTEILHTKTVCTHSQTNTHRHRHRHTHTLFVIHAAAHVRLLYGVYVPPGCSVSVSLLRSPSVFRHFGSMKNKHPGGRAVLCWGSAGGGTRCDVVQVRQRNEWIIEEFTPQWDIAALVKAAAQWLEH